MNGYWGKNDNEPLISWLGTACSILSVIVLFTANDSVFYLAVVGFMVESSISASDRLIQTVLTSLYCSWA